MSIMSLLDCLFLLWKRQTTDSMMAMMITIPAATAITMMYVVLSAALLWGSKSEAAGVGPVSDPTVVVEVATPVDGSEVDDTVVLVVEAEDVAAEEVATEEAAEEEGRHGRRDDRRRPYAVVQVWLRIFRVSVFEPRPRRKFECHPPRTQAVPD